MEGTGWARLAPLTGVAFAVLMAVWFAITGETPDPSDTASEVVEFWSDRETRGVIGSVIAGLAAVALLWFGGSLRATLRRAEGAPGRVSAIGFAGIIVLAVGILIFAALEFTLADTVDDVPPEVTQTLSVMDSDMFFPVAAGFVTVFLATAVVVLRTKVLPAWVAWVAIALALLTFTPIGFFAFLIGILWIAVLGVLLYLRGEPEHASFADGV